MPGGEEMWLIFRPNLLTFHGQTRERFMQRHRQVRWWWLAGWMLVLAGSVGTGDIPAPAKVVQIAPEVVHKQFQMSAPPAVINVLEVRLGGGVQLASLKAGSRLAGRAPLSTLLKAAGPQVVAGVNGDFFSEEGIPIGLHIVEGQVVKRAGRNLAIGMTISGRPFLGVAALEARLLTRRTTMSVNGINRGRGQDELIVYNSFFGESTRTNRWGIEATLRLLAPLRVNDTIAAVVDRVESLGNRPIPPQGLVLSAHGRAAEMLQQSCAVGDTVRVWLGLSPVQEPVNWAVGGGPQLVRNGQVATQEIAAWGNGSFASGRHPRTAAGFSADSTLFWLVTVDGRQPDYSEGMTLGELAEFLVQLGVHQAINLDGGGSTTMVINGKVVNRPAEGGEERAIANAIIVRRNASEGP